VQILILFTLFFSIFTPEFANFPPKNANLENVFPKSAIFKNFPPLKVKNMGKFFHNFRWLGKK